MALSRNCNPKFLVVHRHHVRHGIWMKMEQVGDVEQRSKDLG